MKKVLIIATVGGFLKQFEMNDVQILQDMEYEIHYAANMENCIYHFNPQELIDRNIHLHHINIHKSPFAVFYHIKAVRELVEIIRQEHVNFIHCHTPVGGYLGRKAGKICGISDIKVFYTSHGFHFYKGAPPIQKIFFYLVEKHLAKLTDVMITINKEDYEIASSFRMKKGGSVWQIPGVGLDMEQFDIPDQDERQKARKKLNISDDTFFLLSVGELNKNKNYSVILKALCELNRSSEMKDIVYGICGDGPQKKDLYQKIRIEGLDQQVFLYGYCNSIREFLAAADAFVFPSRREGMGMAALEALAMGIPVLASDNRGTREYMHNEENGYVCNWKNPSDFVSGIRKLKGCGQKERNKMKMLCRESVRPFSIGNTEKMMRKIYKTIG